ncbi:P-loop containing nucleoside triphosphate hydrolase protein [Pavlovales sp. CCMP2436]|nr:P-loop containing nucleoside triphosphate hydrolase protein [Pavlovales sp. CCMP2436]
MQSLPPIRKKLSCWLLLLPTLPDCPQPATALPDGLQPPSLPTKRPLSRRKVVDKTGGAAVLIDGATVSVGDADLIAGGHLRVGIGERWGLVGVNGCGKSTLLRAILRNGEARSALRWLLLCSAQPLCLSVGYLEQTAVTGSERSVKEEVMSRMERLVAAKDAYDVASERVSNGDCSDAAIELLGETEAAYGRAGGYDSDKLVANVLRGLGFSEADEERMCAEFSGGWRMRIGLARLLLSNPELLILDEPSNHLDSSAKRWLGNYLKAYEGTLLIVSHDESILDAAATSIAEVISNSYN